MKSRDAGGLLSSMSISDDNVDAQSLTSTGLPPFLSFPAYCTPEMLLGADTELSKKLLPLLSSQFIYIKHGFNILTLIAKLDK